MSFDEIFDLTAASWSVFSFFIIYDIDYNMNINTIIIYNSSKLLSAYELYEHQLNLKLRIHYIMTMRAVHRYHGYHIGT